MRDSHVIRDGRAQTRGEAQPPSFSAWLRDAMGRQGLSAGTLARRAGVPVPRASGWVLGTRRPEEDEVVTLAEALGVTASEVFEVLRRG